jgi:replicative DNA helicase
MNQVDDIELAVIGLIVNNSESISEVLARLTADHFSDEPRQIIFKTIKKMVEQAKQINILTLGKEIAANYDIATKISCTKVVASTMDSYRFTEPLSEYITILNEAYISRVMPSIISEELMNSDKTLDGFRTATSIIEKLSKLIDSNSAEDKLITTSELMDDERKLYYLQEEMAKGGKLIGVDTGIKVLNDYTGGWQSELIVIAGRPSMGKTALAIFHGLSTNEYGVYINCEMSKSQLAQRLILNQADGSIDGGRLKKRILTQQEKMSMEQSIGAIES